MKLRCDVCYTNVEPTDFMAAKEKDCVNCAWTCPKCGTVHGLSIPGEIIESKMGYHGQEIIKTYVDKPEGET